MRILVPLLLGIFAATTAHPQGETLPAGGRAMEIESRERWMHGRQQPGFTPFVAGRRWLYVDSLTAPSDAGLAMLFRYQAFSGMDFTARARVVPGGGVPDVEIAWPFITARNAADSVRLVGYMVFEGSGLDGRPTLPESRLWEAIPTFPATPRAGSRWVDTLDHSASHGEIRQALGGVRWSTIVGDTLVDGRRLWIVRDSARVRYQERWSEEERTLATPARVTRDVQGVLRGRHLYDPGTGLFRLRADTAMLEGEAVLSYADGRSFRTPARYERTRRWTLRDPAAHLARTASLRREADAANGGMGRLPGNDLQRRLAAGDRRAEDSLLSVWRATADPDGKEALLRLLRDYGDWSPQSRARIHRTRWEAGDTAGVMREIMSFGFSDAAGPLSADSVARVLPFLADPGLAFAFGLARDPLYEDLRQTLLARPPASTPDPAGAACTPEGCRLLADQWTTATEPRLRDLALIAHLVQEPALWSDSVLARAGSGSTFLQPAVRLVHGIGSRDPVPPEGADWRAWRSWSGGMAPALMSPFTRRGAARRESFHTIALRFFMARTGRDVAGELRRALEGASSDSARLVYATVLMGLDIHRPDPTEVASRLRSAPSAGRDLARREMLYLLGSAPLVGWRDHPELLDGLLRFALSGEEVWPRLNPDTRRVGFSTIAPGSPTTFLMEDSLPPSLRGAWRDRANLLSGARWASRLATQAAVFVIPTSVERVGPFARLSLMYEGRLERTAVETPRGYAGGVTVYLLETDTGWVLEGFSEWIT